MFGQPRGLVTRRLVNDERGAVRLVRDALADAADCADSVDSSRTDDDEVGIARPLDKRLHRMGGVPAFDSICPSGVALDRLAAGRGHDLDGGAESAGELVSGMEGRLREA